MTRINVGIPPQRLTSKHLLAEHRELVRIPNTVRSGKARVVNIPDTFRLGTGHVKFFYNKLGYLQSRYHSLYEECIHRGFKVTYFGDAFKDIKPELMKAWQHHPADIKLIITRIRERGGFKDKKTFN